MIVAVFSAGAAIAAPADVITVGTRIGVPGTTVDVPVYIRDTSGTPLGIDQPPGSRIQSYSIKVDYSPASAVQSITFTRAGITQSLTPTFENSPSGPGTVSLIDTFNESTSLIPFTSNAALPGNQIGVLHVTLAAAGVVGTPVTLTLDPTLTQLTDQGGSPATKETVNAGNLTLVNGSIALVADIPAMSHWMLVLFVAALGVIALRLRM
jgi:hypothetical protein